MSKKETADSVKLSAKKIEKTANEQRAELIDDKIFKPSVQRCYLVDYENVKWDGLQGIAELDKHSAVIIFYSKNADKLPLDIAQILTKSNVKVEHVRVEVGLRNALDFQLVSYLGYLIAQHQRLGRNVKYFMVTKDGGFESVKQFWRGYGVHIHRVTKIERDPPADEEQVDTSADVAYMTTTLTQPPQAQFVQQQVSEQSVLPNTLTPTPLSSTAQIIQHPVPPVQSVPLVSVDSVYGAVNGAVGYYQQVVPTVDKQKIGVGSWNGQKGRWDLEKTSEVALKSAIAVNAIGVLQNNQGVIYDMIIISKTKVEFNNRIQKKYSKQLPSQQIGQFIRKINAYLPYKDGK